MHMPVINMLVINAALLALTSSLAASIVLKVTVTLALGLIAAKLARRSRAAIRHTLLAAVFGVLLVLPIASMVAPAIRILVPAPSAAENRARIIPVFAAATEATAPAASAHASDSVASVVTSIVTPAAPSTGLPQSPRLSTSALLLAIWIAGTALFLLPMAIGLWQVRRLRRSAVPWPHGQSVLKTLARDAGIHRRVEMRLHAALTGPMTCGIVHPAIVLPEDAKTWDQEDLNRAIVHELEHVRRGDWVSHCLARAVCAAYWFHPLVWIAWRRFALEAERSCDDAVLGCAALGRSEATAYADQLVALAQRMSFVARAATAKSPLLAMANRADLATRVGAVLDHRQRRGRAGTLSVALTCAAAVAIVFTLSPLSMVAAPQPAITDISVAPTPTAIAAAPQAATTPVTVAPVLAPVAIAAEPQAPATNASAPAPQLTAKSTMVIVNVTVRDKSGKPIEGLSANDLVVTEDGVPQRIVVFEFQKLPATPLDTPDSPSSYYILGYDTENSNLNGEYRKIEITGKTDAIAKLEFRTGYYARSPDVPAGPAVPQAPAPLVRVATAAPVAIAAAPIRVVHVLAPLALAAEPQAPRTPASAVPRFSAKSILVIVDAMVSDRSGNPIEGLTANDFVVTEDGVPQRIMVFEFQKLAQTTGVQSSVSSYYILGYYTANSNLDGGFRKIQITRTNDAMAKLDFRTGYYARSPNLAGGDAQGDADRTAALDLAQPVLITKILPEYSEEARKAKWQGTVRIDVVVDEHGVPIDLKITRALGLGLDQKAMEAVSKWRFKPATKDGKPVTSQARMDVEFRLF